MMKGKKLAVWFAVIFVCGAVALISRLIEGNYDVWSIIGVISSAVMVICGGVGLVVACFKKRG